MLYLQPKPVDLSQLRKFHGRLSEATSGPLRWLLLIYLRTYESLRKMLDHRARKRTDAESAAAALGALPPGPSFDAESSIKGGAGEGVLLEDNLCPFDAVEPSGPGLLAKRTNAVLGNIRAVWLLQRRGVDWDDDGNDDENGVERGTRAGDAVLAAHAAAAAASASVAKEVSLARDDPDKLTYVCGDREGYDKVCRHTRVRRGCAHCTIVARKESRSRSNLGFADGGAGPAEFWQHVSWPYLLKNIFAQIFICLCPECLLF